MIEISAIVVGETRTWNEQANEDWKILKDILHHEDIDLKVYGCTWSYCTYPNPNDCFEEVNVLDFNNNHFRRSELAKYAEEYTNVQLQSRGLTYTDEPEFFWNWTAQYCQWAWMLDRLYRKTNTQYVFKSRWDHTIRDNRHHTVAEMIRRSYDRMDAMNNPPCIDVVDLHLYTNEYEKTMSLRDRVRYNDMFWGLNRAWMDVSLKDHTPYSFISERFLIDGYVDVDHQKILKKPEELVILSNYSEDCFDKIGGITDEVKNFSDLGDIGKQLSTTKRLPT